MRINFLRKARQEWRGATAAVTGLILALSVWLPVCAQGFPSKSITLVVPYQAGGSSDAIARSMARLVGKELGQQVVVENKAGAEGMIGSMDVMKSAPDGYRVLWGCLLYTSPSPRDRQKSRMPSSA